MNESDIDWIFDTSREGTLHRDAYLKKKRL